MVTINIGSEYPRRRRKQKRYRSQPRFQDFSGGRYERGDSGDTGGYSPGTGGGLAWNPINFPGTWTPGGNFGNIGGDPFSPWMSMAQAF